MEDYSETKMTETLLEWYPDSGTVIEVLELIDNESSKLSKGKISILYEIPFHTNTHTFFNSFILVIFQLSTKCSTDNLHYFWFLYVMFEF